VVVQLVRQQAVQVDLCVRVDAAASFSGVVGLG
jgi:hypothetical protein